MQEVVIRNVTRPLSRPLTAGYCESFLCRLRGLMMRTELPPNWGLLLVGGRESRLDAAIHMLFMRVNLAIVWLDRDKRVVDVRPAYRWRSVLLPRSPAQYILELAVDWLGEFEIGDQIQIERPAPSPV